MPSFFLVARQVFSLISSSDSFAHMPAGRGRPQSGGRVPSTAILVFFPGLLTPATTILNIGPLHRGYLPELTRT